MEIYKATLLDYLKNLRHCSDGLWHHTLSQTVVYLHVQQTGSHCSISICLWSLRALCANHIHRISWKTSSLKIQNYTTISHGLLNRRLLWKTLLFVLFFFKLRRLKEGLNDGLLVWGHCRRVYGFMRWQCFVKHQLSKAGSTITEECGVLFVNV